MSAIVGIVSKSRLERCRGLLTRMISSIGRETFYNKALHLCSDIQVHIGWACHNGEFFDCMPIYNEARDVILFAAGEIFHDRNVVQSLKQRGHQFSDENAEYLVHLYEENGINFIKVLNGWFSGLIIDHRLRKAFIFNDRYGMQRIFIHESKNELYFASEAKALLAVLPETRDFDLQGLSEFLACGCTIRSHSLYKDISILPPASLWEINEGEINKKTFYFKIEEWKEEQKLNRDQFVYGFKELIGQVVKMYAEGALPVGISLTGGLDSRMIMACLDNSSDGFPCYSFGSMYRDTYDVMIAKQVANICNHVHQVLVLGEDFLSNFPYYLEKAVYLSDGYLGMSGAAELYLNTLARVIAPVRLTGNYGGELLRGDRAFKCEVPESGFVSSDLNPYFVMVKNAFEDIISIDAVSFALFHQAPSQGYGRLTIERSQVVLRSPFMDNDLVRFAYRAPQSLSSITELSLEIISKYKPVLLTIPTDRGLLLGSERLRYFVQQLYRETLFKAEYWSSHGMPTWLAKISWKGFERFLQDNFLGRHKFQHFRLWSQQHLSDYISDILMQGSYDLRQFFSKHQVETMINDHLTGRNNYLDQIDKLLTIYLTYHFFLKGRAFDDEPHELFPQMSVQGSHKRRVMQL